MKYASFLPFSALVALGMISLLVFAQVLPPGSQLLTEINNVFDGGLYWVIFLIILLESIVYVGFYFPGQFFAVVLVVGANPKASDVVYLTIAMVLAATIGSIINYSLGRFTKSKDVPKNSPTKIRNLLLAMIHINSLAFFMFAQGANKKPIKVVALAGLLNMPYYLLLIAGTAILSEQVMEMAENTYMLVSVISVWLIIALYFDIKKYKQEKRKEDDFLASTINAKTKH
jgi:membrane-associated protein